MRELSGHQIPPRPPNNEAYRKIPSRIAFLADNPSFSMKSTCWGFDVDPNMNSYFWTKLLLHDNSSLDEFDDEVLMNTTLQGDLHPALFPVNCQYAEQVITEYLRHVLEFTWEELKQNLDIKLDSASVHLQFTFPASWSQKARALIRRAVTNAWGFKRDQDTLGTDLSESEAAAKAVFDYRQIQSDSEFKANRGDGILICDCGGGTVVCLLYVY